MIERAPARHDADPAIKGDDMLDDSILHVFNGPTEGHCLVGFPFLLCPCAPEVEIGECIILIIHRGTQ